MIYFTCPGCQRIGQAPDEMAGKAATCPGCGQQMLVPHFVLAGSSAPAAPATSPAAAPSADNFLRFFCPHCRRKLKVPSSAANSIINCKRCGWRIEVAAATHESPAPPPRSPASPGAQSVLAYLPDIIPEAGGHYYYIKNGQRYGPVTGQALRQMASSGQLLQNDWVWKPGFANWKHASKAKGLFPPAAPPSNTPPPAPRSTRPPAPPRQTPPAALPRPNHVPAAPLPTQRPSAIREESTPTPVPVSVGIPLPNAPAFVDRGLARAEQADHDRALADLDAALQLDPHNAQALAARGVIYAKSKGNYQRGLTDLAAAIHLAPRETALYELRAVLFREIGDLIHAQADERRAAELGGHK